MKLGGLVPFTLTDYPGQIAAVIFTQGCNLACPFCHNKALIPKKPCNNRGLSPGHIMEFLKGRKGKLQAVVISGGEPTLQKDLKEFILQIKQMGFKVKLDTNGTRPEVLKDLLEEGLLDFVAMDIKAPWPKYRLLTGTTVDIRPLRESIQTIIQSGVDHLFRTTVVPHLLTQEDISFIREQLPDGIRYITQPYQDVSDSGA